MKDEGEALLGVVLRGEIHECEKLIKAIENNEKLHLIYVKRASSPRSYLLIVETRKAEGKMNATHR